MSRVVEITTDTFDRDALQASEPVLVDFYATWCGPCKMLAPMLEQLAEEFDGLIAFRKANVDEEPELAARYRINAVPTLVLLRGGIVIDTMVGLVPSRTLRQKLAKTVDSPASVPAGGKS